MISLYKNLKKMLPKKDNPILSLIIGVILVLLIRTYLVQYSYNLIWPKLTVNSGNSDINFVPLTFRESFIFVVLISFLF